MTNFKFIKETFGQSMVDLEIAYQLKRIADSLDSRQKPSNITSAEKPSNKDFKTTERLLQKWAKEKISPKTKGLLVKQHGMKESDLENLTQLEAHQLIENLKRKNI